MEWDDSTSVEQKTKCAPTSARSSAAKAKPVKYNLRRSSLLSEARLCARSSAG